MLTRRVAANVRYGIGSWGFRGGRCPSLAECVKGPPATSGRDRRRSVLMLNILPSWERMTLERGGSGGRPRS